MESAGEIIVGGQPQQQYEHHGHHHVDRALNAVFYPGKDDQPGDAQAHQRPEQHAQVIVQHRGKFSCGHGAVNTGKAGGQGLEQVPQHPADHHGIDDLNGIGRQQSHAAHPFPVA